MQVVNQPFTMQIDVAPIKTSFSRKKKKNWQVWHNWADLNGLLHPFAKPDNSHLIYLNKEKMWDINE